MQGVFTSKTLYASRRRLLFQAMIYPRRDDGVHRYIVNLQHKQAGGVSED